MGLVSQRGASSRDGRQTRTIALTSLFGFHESVPFGFPFCPTHRKPLSQLSSLRIRLSMHRHGLQPSSAGRLRNVDFASTELEPVHLVGLMIFQPRARLSVFGPPRECDFGLPRVDIIVHGGTQVGRVRRAKIIVFQIRSENVRIPRIERRWRDDHAGVGYLFLGPNGRQCRCRVRLKAHCCLPPG